MAGLFSVRRAAAVARKEVLHIVRDPATLFFSLLIPIAELILVGFAVDTNVRNIRTIVLDQARTQESRALIRRFVNSGDFRLVGEAHSDDDLDRAIVGGQARVGIKIPDDYSRRVLAGQEAQLLVLVDGSEPTVAAEAVNVSHAVVLREALGHDPGRLPLKIEARTRVLFNPDTRSPNFFVPGLMVILCQIMAVMLSATAIVREKERSTLEQLLMTPMRGRELVLGKLLPYLVLTFVELCGIALLMNTLFSVPIHGRFSTVMVMAFPFVLTMLGLGLWISTRANTRDEAMQLAMGTVIPSIFLSGYIVPLDSMPRVFWYVAQLIPATWLIDAARGVILRGAGWAELWPAAAVLSGMAVAVITFSMLSFHRKTG
jgi:ABC-2 type transport system permease protein